jgi:hypothetical protein
MASSLSLTVFQIPDLESLSWVYSREGGFSQN